MATKRTRPEPSKKKRVGTKPKPLSTKSKKIVLTPEQSKLFEEIAEAAKTGDYEILRTANQEILQSLKDLKLIRIRKVLPPIERGTISRKEAREAILAVMREEKQKVGSQG